MYFLEVIGWVFVALIGSVIIYYGVSLLVYMVAKFGTIGFYEGRHRFRMLQKPDLRHCGSEKGKDSKENGES